jgi:signal transduction histidine kinase
MMRSHGGQRDERRRGARAPWLVLAGALAFTAVASAVISTSGRDRDAARFENAMQSAADRLSGRLDIYMSTLRGAAALFAAEPDLSPDDFRRYVARLDVQGGYPGIQGIGWTRRLSREPGSDPDERHAIVYLEPLDERNRAALGFDMYSETTRRQAMRRARDLGRPALSGKVTLVQEIIGPRQPGFLLYVPVYEGGTIPGTESERQDMLAGFAYSPFRAMDLFAGIFGSEQHPRVSFTVYDGESTDSTALLYAAPRLAGHVARHTGIRHVEVAGHKWTVVFESLPEFEAGSARRFLSLFVAAGVVTSLLLFGFALGQARARLAAERANQAKSGFLATMSHELRTPLNAIGGYTDLMLLGVSGPTTDQQLQYLHRIQRAQQHLLGLINDVLNFAKLDAGRVVYNVESVPVPEVVADAAALTAPLAEQKGLSFSISGGPHVHARADAEKAKQVLLNLLSNAVKFTDAGGRVDTSWTVTDQGVDVHVRDSGIGVAPDRIETIFEPFLQVDADLTRMRQGTGLGLSIARELARGMDGDVSVRSTPGVGSTFTFHVPLADGLRAVQSPGDPHS